MKRTKQLDPDSYALGKMDAEAGLPAHGAERFEEHGDLDSYLEGYRAGELAASRDLFLRPGAMEVSDWSKVERALRTGKALAGSAKSLGRSLDARR